VKHRLGLALIGLACVLAAFPAVANSAGAAQTSSKKPTVTSQNSTTPPPGQPTVNSWALAPTGRDPSQPSSRIYLSYDVAPGTTLNDSVTLWNYSNVQLTFHIYATDAFNNPDGAFDLLTADKPPSDAGAWVSLQQANITAPARTKVDIPFILRIPASARPGDHAGAILAANDVEGTTSNGKVVTLDRRTGSRMYIRVSGPLNPALVVENVHTVYHSHVNPFGGSLDVTYTVRNAGNVRLSAHQQIQATGPFGIGRQRHKPADVPELLPNNAITLHQHFSGVAALVRTGADIRLQPFSSAPDVKVSKGLHRSGHTWAIPWSVVVLVLALWLAWRAYVPIRRRRQELRVGSSPQEQLTPVP